MLKVIIRTAGIFLYMIIFYFLMNMGRKKDRQTKPFLLVCAVMVLMVFTLRIYPELKVFNEKLFIIMKAFGGSLIGFSIAFFVYSVFRIDSIKKVSQILFLILLGSDLVFLPVYYFTEKKIFVYILYAVMLLSGIILLCCSVSDITRHKKYKDRQQRFVLISFPVFMFHGIVYMIYEGVLNQPGMPFFLQPGIIAINIFYLYIFVFNLRSEHKSLLLMNTLLEEKVLEKTQALEQALHQKSMVFANLAHETKTPLTLIKNNLDRFVAMNGHSAETREMKRNIDKLIRDIVNILNIERIEKGERSFEDTQIVNVSKIMEQKIDEFSNTAKTAWIDLDSSITENLYVKADPAALNIILNNLFDNAFKFTSENGFVSASLKKKKDMAELIIADSGIGISEEKQQNIFEPFYQISHDKKNSEGVGLGLSLVKKMVDRCDGEIHLKSEVGKGTVFTIHLPLADEADPDVSVGMVTYVNMLPDVSEPITVKDSFYDRNRAKILVVEDNRKMLAFLQNIISDKYNFYYAENGRQALKKLDHIPKPDLILSDVMMDEMNGIQLQKELSRSSEYDSIPFIFLTARDRESEHIDALYNGAADFISKPFSAELLMAKVHSVLRNRHQFAKNLITSVNKNLLDMVTGKQDIVPDPGYANNTKNQLNKDFDRKYNLSAREVEISELILKGFQYKEIALKLDISVSTVETYRKRIFKKCKVQNKSELFSLLK